MRPADDSVIATLNFTGNGVVKKARACAPEAA